MSEAPNQSAAPKKAKGLSPVLPALVVTLVAVLAVGGVWVWKGKQADELETRLTAEKTKAVQQAQADIAKAKAEAQKALATAQRDKLQLFGAPLGWALRNELTNNNVEQMTAYVDELVKTPGIDRVVVARADGVIAAASDRKMQDAQLTTAYPAIVNDAQSPTVLDGDGGKLVLAVPVYGLTGKLGVLALTFDPAVPAPPLTPPPAPSAASAPAPAAGAAPAPAATPAPPAPAVKP